MPVSFETDDEPELLPEELDEDERLERDDVLDLEEPLERDDELDPLE